MLEETQNILTNILAGTSVASFYLIPEALSPDRYDSGFHFYMHSGGGAKPFSLAWVGTWLWMDGLQTNLVTSGFA